MRPKKSTDTGSTRIPGLRSRHVSNSITGKPRETASPGALRKPGEREAGGGNDLPVPAPRRMVNVRPRSTGSQTRARVVILLPSLFITFLPLSETLRAS
ncbi:hypothetical protein NL676_017883 [Syzygium grande]|nr:hypothetical protein NL676_017883 [Syzygium grande]